MKYRIFAPVLIPCCLLGLLFGVVGPRDAPAEKPGESLDQRLHVAIKLSGITPFDPGPAVDANLVRLGQMLFFDKELSGNRDIACATCHHPSFETGDALSLSIGTGGTDLGIFRTRGDGRPFIPRNSPELFNRGMNEWTSMFWDSRIEELEDGTLVTPAGDVLPEGLANVLAAQAMFPVTSRDEMRGTTEDGTNDPTNELADIADGNLQEIWAALMDRLLSYAGYQQLFADAYPGIPQELLGFQDAANAIGAFEAAAFTLADSPWDQYVGGDASALSEQAKRGGVLFFGKAGCVGCHSGNLLTDQQHHNIGVPQLGPGKGPEAPSDFGRFRETGDAQDLFAFRTPPLRNVTATGPWMHNGAYLTLEGAVRHHFDVTNALKNYDASQLEPDLRSTVQDDAATISAILQALDPKARRKIKLSEPEFFDLMAFLEALTSESLEFIEESIPDSVPSGLPVDMLSE